MKRKIFFHLGLPKTGTTFLQREYFQQIENIRYLGKFEGVVDNIYFTTKLFYFLFGASKNEFICTGVNALHEELELLEKKIFGKIQPEVPLLISDEELVCQILLPRKVSKEGFFSLNIKEGFERLKMFQDKVNLDFYFIYCHRDPAEFFHSFYAQFYWYFSQQRELNTFFKYVNYGLSGAASKLGFAVIVQKQIAQVVKNIFSETHLYETNYEYFVENPATSVDEISRFLMVNKTSEPIDFTIKHNSRRTGGSDILRFGDKYPHWIPRKSSSMWSLLMNFLSAVYNKVSRRDTKNSKVEIELSNEIKGMFAEKE